MNGNANTILNIMGGNNKRFVIPVYQRRYSWKEENCKQIFNDLVRMVHTGRKTHFFGSVVSVNESGQRDVYRIIDGQQRITTISLLLLAMVHLLKEGKLHDSEGSLADEIMNNYLINPYMRKVVSIRDKIKLKPIQEDREALGRLFENDSDEFIPASQITVNYRYFEKRLLGMDVNVDDLYDAVQNLEVIDIILEVQDDPQLIFESLNSTGLDLSEGDKICNYVLMNQPEARQETLYDAYWKKIISICGNDGIDWFVRDYLSVKTLTIPTIGKIYQPFKNFAEEKDIETLLADMLAYGKRYQKLLGGDTGSKELNNVIFRLNYLRTDITRPFLLEVLRLNEEGIVTIEDAIEIFKTVENYIFRRTICNIATNSMNKTFLRLHKEIIDLDGTEDNYAEKFKYILLRKQTYNIHFPNDEEFQHDFSERDIYHLNRCGYILERLENFGTVEVLRNITDGLRDKIYSIEHIMPQTMTQEWKEDLGPDYERIHENWLHRIANLTLTGYNSKLSNLPFSKKKEIDGGFKQSGFRMNQSIAGLEQWGEAELEARNDELMDLAIKIWPYPETSYRPAEKLLESFSLDDDDIESTGKQISKYSFKGLEMRTSDWISMYANVVRSLYDQDQTLLTQIASNNGPNADLSTYFNNNKALLRVPEELNDGLWFEKNIANATKMSVLRRLFVIYGEDPADLVFFIKDELNNEQKNDEEIRHDYRRRYWTVALEKIHEGFPNKGEPFHNTFPGKDYYKSGYFGIAGFHMTCTISTDSCGAYISLENSSYEKNKTTFDWLYERKDAIEEQIGEPMWWNRADKYKWTGIGINEMKFGLYDEEHWNEMADFQAKSLRKLYDVIVPMIKEFVQQ